MNVLGDLRYVRVGESAAYAATKTRRNARGTRPGSWRGRPVPPRLISTGCSRPATRPSQAAEPRRPLRPLAARPASGRQGEHTVYMHGGPSSVLQGRSLERLNLDYYAPCRPIWPPRPHYVRRAAADRGRLRRRPDAAAARVAALPPGEATLHSRRKSSASRLPTAMPCSAHAGRTGIAGPHSATSARKRTYFARVGTVGARRLVIGHTVARHGTVVSRFDGAVVKLDAGMNRAVYHGRPAALVTDGSGSKVVYAMPETAPAAVPPEPLYLSSRDVPRTPSATS